MRMESVQLSRDLEFYVSSSHWLNGNLDGFDESLAKLLSAIRAWDPNRTRPQPSPSPIAPVALPPLQRQPAWPRLPLIAATAACIIAVTILIFLLTHSRKPPSPDEQGASTKTITPSDPKAAEQTRSSPATQSPQADAPKRRTASREDSVRAPSNDSTVNGASAPLGQWIERTFADPVKFDWFQFKSPEKNRDVIKIDLDNQTRSMKPVLVVYDENKAKLGGTTGWEHQITAGQNIAYSFFSKPAAAYYIGITDASDSTEAKRYRLRIVPARAYDQYEPNDTCDRAPLIQTNTTLEANFMDATDVDCYKLLVPSGADHVLIRFENRSATVKPRIRVLDKNKAEAGGTTGWEHQITAGQDIEYEFSAKPDTIYYICFSDVAGTSGDYRFTVTTKNTGVGN